MEYQRDDAKRLLTRTVSGTLSADDALRRIQDQAADGTWGYASLIDMRGFSSWLTYEQMTRVLSGAQAIARQRGRRGPVAIVIANPALIPVGQTHAVIEHEVGTTGFFRDFDGAARWLEIRHATEQRAARAAFLDQAAPA
jgi:hypothetical protein